MITHGALAAARPVVLVIDGDPAVRNSLKFALEIEGFSVRVYSSGAELLDERDMPESGCIVTDYHLPGMNGLDLLARLGERNVALPAILIATHPSATIRNRAMLAGVRLIEKPLLSDTLFQGIRNGKPPHRGNERLLDGRTSEFVRRSLLRHCKAPVDFAHIAEIALQIPDERDPAMIEMRQIDARAEDATAAVFWMLDLCPAEHDDFRGSIKQREVDADFRSVECAVILRVQKPRIAIAHNGSHAIAAHPRRGGSCRKTEYHLTLGDSTETDHPGGRPCLHRLDRRRP